VELHGHTVKISFGGLDKIIAFANKNKPILLFLVSIINTVDIRARYSLNHSLSQMIKTIKQEKRKRWGREVRNLKKKKNHCSW
jgi:hypothetical protein